MQSFWINYLWKTLFLFLSTDNSGSCLLSEPAEFFFFHHSAAVLQTPADWDGENDANATSKGPRGDWRQRPCGILCVCCHHNVVVCCKMGESLTAAWSRAHENMLRRGGWEEEVKKFSVHGNIQYVCEASWTHLEGYFPTAEEWGLFVCCAVLRFCSHPPHPQFGFFHSFSFYFFFFSWDFLIFSSTMRIFVFSLRKKSRRRLLLQNKTFGFIFGAGKPIPQTFAPDAGKACGLWMNPLPSKIRILCWLNRRIIKSIKPKRNWNALEKMPRKDLSGR